MYIVYQIFLRYTKLLATDWCVVFGSVVLYRTIVKKSMLNEYYRSTLILYKNNLIHL